MTKVLRRIVKSNGFLAAYKAKSEKIEEEINDAEAYIKMALEHKESDKVLADTFAKLSEEELGHMKALHDQVTRIIATYRKEHGDPPERMMGLYEYLHNKHMKEVANVKALHSVYKEA
jgi:hypothetical protein